jgi:hypothetical protein
MELKQYTWRTSLFGMLCIVLLKLCIAASTGPLVPCLGGVSICLVKEYWDLLCMIFPMAKNSDIINTAEPKTMQAIAGMNFQLRLLSLI